LQSAAFEGYNQPHFIVAISRMTPPLIKRHLEPRLRESLEDSPVVLIQGSRQCGKTTLAQMVGKSGGFEYLSLDEEAVYRAAEDDPSGFVRDLPERVIIDEVQKAPRLLSAIKLAVDRNRTAGRFILTGSVSILRLRRITDSLAGRMRIVNLHPFSQCELGRTAPAFLDALFAGDFTISRSATSGNGLVERIVRGGYPNAVGLPTEQRRMAWHRDYIESLVRRDVPDISGIRSLEALSRLLSLAAVQTAQLLNTNSLAKSFQLSRTTIHDYLALLEAMFLVNRLPAWYHNRARRLVKTPKLHLSDTGIACALTDFNASSLSEDRAALGHFLETFVFQELRRQASAHEWRHAFSYYRDKDGAEADLVIERDAASLAGVEVKASATVSRADFTGLRRLRKIAGKRFKCGVLIYTGETCLPFGDDLYAVPAQSLWESGLGDGPPG